MHLNCDQPQVRHLSGLGWIQWAALAYEAYNQSQKNKEKGGSGSGGEGGGGVPGTAITTVTTISPQISPQFIQQQSPVNSPVAAGINPPNVGFAPSTGMMPGFDWFPNLQQMGGNGANQLLTLAAVGLGAFALVRIVRKKKRR